MALVSAASSGAVSASGAVARALAGAARVLPADEDALEEVFRTACGELTLRRVDAALERIAQLERSGQKGAAVLAQLSQRTELLALRRRVLESLGRSAG
jgi:DNA primase